MSLDISSQFEIEKLSRDIDKCTDIDFLKTKLKEMIHLYYQHKNLTKELLFQNEKSF